jgi:transcription elongation GreA/GreB family factor
VGKRPLTLTTTGRYSIRTGKKKRIHQLIIERLTADLAVFSVAARTAHEASIHEENIPDNKYDTLSLEASYVAQGQANRAQEIKRALHAYRTLALQGFEAEAAIRLTALVTLEAEDGEKKTLFIGPEEGGLKLNLDGEEILVITPGSPLGNDLIGKCAGDVVSIGINRLKRDFEIILVC